MFIALISFLAKLTSLVSRFFKIGAGVTWPGEISLRLYPKLINTLLKQVKKGVVIVGGTNGKTTTASMISHILTQNGEKVVHNSSGANLKNGIAGTLILNTNWLGKLKVDYAVFEVDELTLPLLISDYQPKILVLLNLFRDQLDRYGEIDLIAQKWLNSFKPLKKTILVVNADDPLIAFISKQFTGKVFYFGLNNQQFSIDKPEFAIDSSYCFICGGRLVYKKMFLSHYGDWYCPICLFSRPKLNLSEVQSPLKGVYTIYNALASVLTASMLGISQSQAEKNLTSFKPVFGRQEEFLIKGRRVQIFLVKNPAGFNSSLRTVLAEKIKNLVFILNNQIPDGRDVSWIWDVDFEKIVNRTKLFICSGDRAYDMALRVKYALPDKGITKEDKIRIFPDLKQAFIYGLQKTNKGETLYLFPNYSAMLNLRQIITGKKIL